jgi:general stress protein 26
MPQTLTPNQPDVHAEDTGERQHLINLIQQFDTAMLVTHNEGRLHARPMAVAQFDADEAVLWFVTSEDSSKTDEMADAPNVAIILQSSMAEVAASGTATVVHDRERIAALWTEAWRVWFPEGPYAKDIVLVKVELEDSEYWDHRGAKGLRYLFRAAKAYVAGEEPEIAEPEQHGVVDEP